MPSSRHLSLTQLKTLRAKYWQHHVLCCVEPDNKTEFLNYLLFKACYDTPHLDYLNSMPRAIRARKCIRRRYLQARKRTEAKRKVYDQEALICQHRLWGLFEKQVIKNVSQRTSKYYHDCIQEAYETFINAIRAYDPSMGGAFWKYLGRRIATGTNTYTAAQGVYSLRPDMRNAITKIRNAEAPELAAYHEDPQVKATVDFLAQTSLIELDKPIRQTEETANTLEPQLEAVANDNYDQIKEVMAKWALQLRDSPRATKFIAALIELEDREAARKIARITPEEAENHLKVLRKLLRDFKFADPGKDAWN